MKKKAIIPTLFLTSALLLAACTNQNPDTSEAAKPVNAAAAIQVTTEAPAKVDVSKPLTSSDLSLMGVKSEVKGVSELFSQVQSSCKTGSYNALKSGALASFKSDVLSSLKPSTTVNDNLGILSPYKLFNNYFKGNLNCNINNQSKGSTTTNCKRSDCTTPNCNGSNCNTTDCKNSTCATADCNTSKGNSCNNTTTCNKNVCTTPNCNGTNCSTADCKNSPCTKPVTPSKPESSSSTPSSSSSTPSSSSNPSSSTPSSSSNSSSSNNSSSSSSQTEVPKDDAIITGGISLSSEEIAAFKQSITSMVNEARAQNGVGKLSYSATLDKGAKIRAQEQASSFSHTRPNGQSFSSVMSEIGYKYTRCGENLFYVSPKVQNLAEKAFTSWKNSPGHWENILRGEYTEIGVGLHTDGSKVYAVQLFGTPAK